MKLNVERMSKNGIYSGSRWYNISKFAKPLPSLAGIEVGMEVEVAVNSKGWVTAISMVNGASPEVQTPEVKPPVKAEGKKTTKQHEKKTSNRTVELSSEERKEVARSEAVKAVLGSPLLYAIYKNDSDKGKTTKELSVLIRQFTAYILTGVFDEFLSPVSESEGTEKVNPVSEQGTVAVDTESTPPIESAGPR